MRKSGASGPLWRVDHWLGQKPGKRAENREKVRSQWTTLKSGPLAGAEAGEKARKLEKSQKLPQTKKAARIQS